MIDCHLKDKVVLITGANHGIGAATAKAFADQKARIFITYYRSDCPYSKDELEEAKRSGVGGDLLYSAMQQQSADAVLNIIRDHGGTATAVELDLGNVENITKLFDLCEETIGPPDILIINHTHCVPETFDPALVTDQRQLINTRSIDTHFVVNARAGALMMLQYLQCHIRRNANWGRIVSLTTTSAHARLVSYAASKHALVSYTITAAQEMGKYGITANVVCPGATQTGYITPDMDVGLAAQTPLGRVGQPEDVADVIVFLASEQAHWLTGQLIYASGGFIMHQ